MTEVILPDRNNTNAPVSFFKFMEDIKHDGTDVLQYHQKIVQQFFLVNKKGRGLLIYHGTGVGKTMLAVAIAEVMKSERQVIILSPKSLHENFRKEIRKYSQLTKTEDSTDNYSFVSSNASNVLRQLSNRNKTKEDIKFEKTLDMENEIDLEGTLVIVDEAQNFFNGIAHKSANAMGMYRAIIEAKNVKIIFLSGTPIVNEPFEIVPIFNMLYGGRLLPEAPVDFYNLYVDMEKGMIRNKEKLKNRIFGLVSYTGDWWRTGGITTKETEVRENFPDQLSTIVEHVKMSIEQFAIYSSARDAEKNSNRDGKPSNGIAGSSYRTASRQLSNFLIPEVAKTKNMETKKYIKHIEKITDEHFEQLHIYSPKMKKMIKNINKHEGLNVVYSSFVSGEGLRIFSKVLDYNGWKAFDPYWDGNAGEQSKHSEQSKRSEHKEPLKYAIISGDVPSDDRDAIISKFISDENKNGEVIKLLMISSVGAEGLDLRNVRSVHIMEPYWNYGRIEQIIARAVRYRSHESLPESKRNVQPYIYLSDYPVNYVFKPTKKEPLGEKTTDVYLYKRSIKNKQLIDKMYAVMIEASIDCSIHAKTAPPAIRQRIKCLMCNPTNEMLFHHDIRTDMKIGNPCTDITSSTIRAEEIIYQDKSYYYKINDNGLSIFEFNDILKAYVKLDRSHPHYDNLIEKINVN